MKLQFHLRSVITEMANKRFDFSWEFKNFKIETVHTDYKDKSSPLRKNCPIQIIRYFDDAHTSCYIIAWFKLDDEGYELHFVGSRPFENISPDEISTVWEQLQAAQKMLDAYFEACEHSEDDD